MRKIIIWAFSLIVPGLFSQEIIENPDSPISERAGRTVVLEEVMRITDRNADDFYFRRPNSIYVAPPGALFVRDWGLFFQFDQEGGFLRNLFRKGQGPGEMSFVAGCHPGMANLLVYSPRPSKIMVFDYNGRLEKETTLREMPRFLTLIHRYADIPMFVSWEWPVIEKEEAYAEVVHTIAKLDNKKGVLIPLASFPVKKYILHSSSGAGASFDISRLIVVPLGERYLLVSHNSEYLIHMLDLESGRIARRFRRGYSRIRWDRGRKRGTVILNGKERSTPHQRYENDIVNLLAADNRIWVLTSTRGDKGSVLLDVFSPEGRYLDRFFMRNPAAEGYGQFGFFSIALSGGCLYVIEKDEDGLFSIAKYRIKGL